MPLPVTHSHGNVPTIEGHHKPGNLRGPSPARGLADSILSSFPCQWVNRPGQGVKSPEPALYLFGGKAPVDLSVALLQLSW